MGVTPKGILVNFGVLVIAGGKKVPAVVVPLTGTVPVPKVAVRVNRIGFKVAVTVPCVWVAAGDAVVIVGVRLAARLGED